MSETYCGKSCDECKYREAFGCPGCSEGPGAPYSGNCNLASCCRERGHDRCRMCLDRGACEMLKNRDGMPEERARAAAERAEREAHNREKSAFLGKWLWAMFLLIIPSIIGEVLSILPMPLELIGLIISAAASIAYGAILLVLSKESTDYMIAGICFFGSAVLMLAAAFYLSWST